MSEPQDRQVIWCAGNKTSAVYFEAEVDAVRYAAGMGITAGVDVYPVDLILSTCPKPSKDKGV